MNVIKIFELAKPEGQCDDGTRCPEKDIIRFREFFWSLLSCRNSGAVPFSPTSGRPSGAAHFNESGVSTPINVYTSIWEWMNGWCHFRNTVRIFRMSPCLVDMLLSGILACTEDVHRRSTEATRASQPASSSSALWKVNLRYVERVEYLIHCRREKDFFLQCEKMEFNCGRIHFTEWIFSLDVYSTGRSDMMNGWAFVADSYLCGDVRVYFAD